MNQLKLSTYRKELVELPELNFYHNLSSEYCNFFEALAYMLKNNDSLVNHFHSEINKISAINATQLLKVELHNLSVNQSNLITLSEELKRFADACYKQDSMEDQAHTLFQEDNELNIYNMRSLSKSLKINIHIYHNDTQGEKYETDANAPTLCFQYNQKQYLPLSKKSEKNLELKSQPMLHQKGNDIFDMLKTLIDSEEGIKTEEELKKVFADYQLSLAGASAEIQEKINNHTERDKKFKPHQYKAMLAFTQSFKCPIKNFNDPNYSYLFDVEGEVPSYEECSEFFATGKENTLAIKKDIFDDLLPIGFFNIKFDKSKNKYVFIDKTYKKNPSMIIKLK